MMWLKDIIGPWLPASPVSLSQPLKMDLGVTVDLGVQARLLFTQLIPAFRACVAFWEGRLICPTLPYAPSLCDQTSYLYPQSCGLVRIGSEVLPI